MKASDIIRTYFAAYETQDRETAERLLSNDFTFSSPLDDAINRDTYFERCWPHSHQQPVFRIERIFEEGPEAYVTYECRSAEGHVNCNTEFFVIRAGHIQSVRVFFGKTTVEAVDEQTVRDLLAQHAAAFRAKDVPGLIAAYTPDLLVYDVVTPMSFRGQGRMGMLLLDWLSGFEGPVNYEMQDLSLHLSGDIGYGHCLNHLTGTETSGQAANVWWRSTFGFRKENSRWLICHEHSSMPFDPKTMRVPDEPVFS